MISHCRDRARFHFKRKGQSECLLATCIVYFQHDSSEKRNGGEVHMPETAKMGDVYSASFESMQKKAMSPGT